MNICLTQLRKTQKKRCFIYVAGSLSARELHLIKTVKNLLADGHTVTPNLAAT